MDHIDAIATFEIYAIFNFENNIDKDEFYRYADVTVYIASNTEEILSISHK